MRVFVSSVPQELQPYRTAAHEVARELSFEVTQRDELRRDAMAACARQLAKVDLVLAIVGWRGGSAPSADAGGDGLRPWVYWEVMTAFRLGKPVIAMLAGATWQGRWREEASDAHAVMCDFRAELARLASTFDSADNPASQIDFAATLRSRLLAQQQETSAAGLANAARSIGKLRRWAASPLPPLPYPVLLPYSHPRLLAGRDQEIAELTAALSLPLPILGLSAPSGCGKSSLLAGGLVPALRQAGRPVALDTRVVEPGLAGRLVGDLVEQDEIDDEPAFEDTRDFVDRLLAIRQAAGSPPILVLDQFEDLLLREAPGERAKIGLLLAATVQRVPGLNDPPCRWLLAYRQEFHGRVCRWLDDGIRDASAAGLPTADALPHQLSGPERFHVRSLAPLATPATPATTTTDAAGPAAAATAVFLQVIETPLATGHYPWRFAEGHAERLARAFGDARMANPSAPLVPELQVVLAHLLEQAGEPVGAASQEATVLVEVPEQPEELIDQALERHLLKALDNAFPGGSSRDDAERWQRTRALLALRELADDHGRRSAGLSARQISDAVGSEGHEVLEVFATPRTRLVLLQQQPEGWRYVLSHDRLAELIVRLVDHDGGQVGWRIDSDLLALRRFVALNCQLFVAGDTDQSTLVSKNRFEMIEQNVAALLWGDESRRWWAACRRRREAKKRRSTLLALATVVAAALMTWVIWNIVDRQARRQTLLQQVAEGEAEAAFAALAQLTLDPRLEPQPLFDLLASREHPFDVLDRGLGGVDVEQRGEAVLRVVNWLMPLHLQEPENPAAIAPMAWALDFHAPRDAVGAERAASLRDRILAPLRRKFPPPSIAADDPEWVSIAAGKFLMGPRPEELPETSPEDLDDLVEVEVAAFRIMKFEVSNAQYRRLMPAHPGPDNVAAGLMNWFFAYTYAAWLGGRLPTDAEWEYAARAGCEFSHCRRDGSAAEVAAVAWHRGTSVNPQCGFLEAQPRGLLEPNPWGLYDVFGNVLELTANWYGPAEQFRRSPGGDPGTSSGWRTLRGGAVIDDDWLISISRTRYVPSHRSALFTGARVVLPGL